MKRETLQMLLKNRMSFGGDGSTKTEKMKDAKNSESQLGRRKIHFISILD